MESHVVRPGETLSGIAQSHGTSWQAIAQMNALASPDRLVVGQRLTLPASGSPRSPAMPTAPRPGSPAPQRQAAQPPTGQPPAAPTPAPPPTTATAQAGDVTEAQLRAIMPQAGRLAATFLRPLNDAMRTHGITGAEQRAAFLAQISVESGDLHNTEENLNYSAPRLHAVWPRRFPSVAAAQPYAHNPQALGNHVYASRLGNGNEQSGDGYRYRGRGLMQTTGRSNYRSAGFEGNPEALANPATAADSAGRFWNANNLNPRTTSALNRSQFDGITYTVNGGYNGAADRWAAYGRARRALVPAEAPAR